MQRKRDANPPVGLASSTTSHLGIGVITQNRLPILRQTIAEIVQLIQTPYTLVIADDGSDDGTVAWARDLAVPVVTGPRRGCAWNKNRALYYLLTSTDCDPLLLLEDDTRPTAPDWATVWSAAGRRWQHVNYCYGWDRASPPPGSGTVDEPYRCNAFGGHCTVTSRAALREVGYLDPRFRGYGWEHVEWTWRFQLRYRARWPDGLLPCLDHGVTATWPPSSLDQREMDANGALYARIRAGITGPYHCEAWCDDGERRALHAEIADAQKLSTARQQIGSRVRELRLPDSLCT